MIMGKKIANTLLFLAVLAAGIGMTLYVGQGAVSVLVYNFIFLAVMVVIYVICLFGGMFRMNDLARAFRDAAEGISNAFQAPGKAEINKIQALGGIFQHRYLDRRMNDFTEEIGKSAEGLADIEEYFNEDELDNHIHKRLLEMAPDIFTSLGILGTFVGLVWGLKNFEPSNYEAMTNSVSALVDGIKVAFLTSIYGISLSESMNLLVSSQKNQTAAMNQMAEEFSVKMADSFEKVITPTFKKMNDSLDVLVSSVTRCQEDAVKEILDAFLKEMNNSFQTQFSDFGKALERLKDAQTDNTNYTTNLYQAMSRQLSDSYVQHEAAMKKILEESGKSQKQYLDTANRLVQDNQIIQKQQQADYHHLADYLKEAETSSAKFWVACNQTMQKYVEAAAQGMDRVSAAGKAGSDLMESNRRVVEEFDARLQEFAEYQKRSYRTMEQVRRLLSDITAAKEKGEIRLSAGRNAQNETMEKLQEILTAQSEQQQEILEEMSKNIREMAKASGKGKFGLFR